MSEVPNECINNMMEFLERDKVYEHLIKDVILLDTVELQRVEKIIVSVFVVDKRLHKLFLPTKDTVIKPLTSRQIKPQWIIKGKRYFMWIILLSTLAD